VTRRDEYAHLDDFGLAARHLEANAEIARLEGETLADPGYGSARVVGLSSMLLTRAYVLFTIKVALAEVWAIRNRKG
jgi:hypothetical protein